MRDRAGALWSDEDGTSSEEFVMICGLVAIPLLLLYGLFLGGLSREFGFLSFLLSQAAP